MKKWIFGCNFDVLDAFAESDFVDWGTNCNVVYLYMGPPIKKFLIKIKVTTNDVSVEEKE